MSLNTGHLCSGLGTRLLIHEDVSSSVHNDRDHLVSTLENLKDVIDNLGTLLTDNGTEC
jgi:hypothetical protein